VCERLPVELLVLLNAMVPAPGERAGEWWDATGHEQARREDAVRRGHPDPAAFDLEDAFLHDLPPDVRAGLLAGPPRPQSGRPFEDPWPLPGWPAVPTRFVQGGDDRFFPLDFQRRVVRERLGIAVDVVPGGHLTALSRPKELADRLESYLELGSAPTAGARGGLA
jgi:pimeloyl-ACP methyl ester carboxylesterase